MITNLRKFDNFLSRFYKSRFRFLFEGENVKQIYVESHLFWYNTNILLMGGKIIVAELKIEKVYKKFPQGQTDLTVLKDINLQVKDGEFLVLVGASGCGKSTLLRLIAGLENISNGEIYIGDRLVNNLPPKQRDIAMVFQNYALYPHLNIYDNMAFGLRRTKNPDANFKSTLENFVVETSRILPKPLQYMSKREREIKSKVENIAQLLQIEKLLNRYPKQLSGGQKQRVALGRAIARNPQVFLMDEPLSNLDAKLRTETRTQIVKLQQQLGVTTIYVTHDQTEAMTMGDRIAVMNKGEIQQIASPLELYHQPANLFVAQFIGSPSMNFIPVRVTEKLEISHPQFTLKLPEKWRNILEKYQQKPVILGIRPEHIKLGEKSPENLPVKVDIIEALGHETYLTVKYAETKDLQMRIEPNIIVKTGQEIWLKIDLEKIHLFDEETEKNIMNFHKL
jgi:multiple sugar transport system ATP-binding protein